MKRLIILFIMGMSLFTQSLLADEGKGSASSFWDKLRSKVESLTPQKKLGATTATGGVRGAPASSEDLYWKSEATEQAINADELDAFEKAVKLAEVEDKAPAQAAFSEFVKKYPASSLRKEAFEALVLLQNANAPAANAPAANAPAANAPAANAPAANAPAANAPAANAPAANAPAANAPAANAPAK